jgi:hypothetical protein
LVNECYLQLEHALYRLGVEMSEMMRVVMREKGSAGMGGGGGGVEGEHRDGRKDRDGYGMVRHGMTMGRRR